MSSTRFPESSRPSQPMRKAEGSSSRRSFGPMRVSLHPIPDSYFGEDVCDSPNGSIGSDDTLSDTFVDSDNLDFGYPLQRVPRRDEAFDLDQQVSALLKVSPSSSCLPSRSASLSSLSSAANYDMIDYDAVLAEMIGQFPDSLLCSKSRKLIPFIPGPTSRFEVNGPPLMFKEVARSSPELLVLLELSHPELRQDPWNPVPHILKAIERDDRVYLCMQGLSDYDDPPFVTIVQYLDFCRQVLEGLTFLHEKRVTGLNCSEPSSYMVDLSSAPRPVPSTKEVIPSFDRFSYPVRYYFVNFSKASRMPAGVVDGGSPYKKDVKECGVLFDRIILHMPQISQKFKPLTRSMINGNFSAENARRLFEALCGSLDASIFESNIVSHPDLPL